MLKLSKNVISKMLLSIITILLIITQTSCSLNDNNQTTSKDSFYLNTTCSIEIQGMDTDKADKLINKAFSKCADYENIFSRTVKGSDIYNINNANGAYITVNDETLFLIKQAIDISEKTNGAYDITVGKLEALWDFSNSNPKVPETSDIQSIVSNVGYKNILINGNQVALSNPDAWLDLGSIAKGYIAQKLGAYLEDEGVKTGIVNLGGNIVTIGNKADGDKWEIGIEKAYSDRSDIIGSVKLKDETIVTSGIYERHFEENGKDYHHILTPSTGYPVDTDILSISIRSANENSYLCDALATASLLVGKEDAIKLLQKYSETLKNANNTDLQYCIVTINNKIYTSDKFNMTKAE